MHSGIPTKVLTAGVAGTLLASLTACGSGSASGSGVHIVTSVYPLEWLASQVGGDAVTVTNLTEAGADPHEVELSPRQIGTVADADLVLHIRGLQPAVDDAVDQHAADRFLDPADVVDLLPVSSADHEHDGHAEEQHSGADSHSHGGKDPHLWLDPERLAEVSAALADRLSDIDPDHAAAYQENHETVAGELSDLSAAYTESLDTCARREIVVTHAAFGYLAEMHDLEQISVTGIDSHHEDPSPPGSLRSCAKSTSTASPRCSLLRSPTPRSLRRLRQRPGLRSRSWTPSKASPTTPQVRLPLGDAGQPRRSGLRLGLLLTIVPLLPSAPSRPFSGKITIAPQPPNLSSLLSALHA